MHVAQWCSAAVKLEAMLLVYGLCGSSIVCATLVSHDAHTPRAANASDIAEVCKAALDSTLHGANKERLARVAGECSAAYSADSAHVGIWCVHGLLTLTVSCVLAGVVGGAADATVNAVLGLSHLFVEMTKANVKKAEFLLAVSDLDLADDGKEQLADFFESCRATVRDSLSRLIMAQPEYHHVDWRLDVELGSRMLRRRVEPSLVLRLDTKETDRGLVSHYLESDFATLTVRRAARVLFVHQSS